MAIPTPKTPTRRSSNIPTITPKKSLSTTKKPASSVRSSQSFTKKTLPTPPSRERFHQEHKAKSSSGGIRSTLISLLIIGAVVMLGWINKDSIIHYLDSLGLRGESAILQNDPNALFVGKEVELTGTLVAGGKSGLYTHTMQSSYGTLGLRSTSINLKDFVGEVKLGGQIMDFVDNTYIIDVRNISFLTMSIAETGQYIDGIQYLPQAGIIVGDMQSNGLTLSEGGTTNPDTLTITNTITNSNLIIRYFSCDESVSRNCRRFVESFQKSVGIDFVDSFGNVFYKLADGNTWFVSLDNRIGMYIETKDATMIPLVIRNIQFVTNEWAKKTFVTKATSICTSSEATLRSVTALRTLIHDGEIAVEATGPSNTDKNAICLISIDPTTTLLGKLISIGQADGVTTEEETVSPATDDTDTEETTTNTTPLSANGVKQFALKPGKEVKFTSRGNTIVFPSPSIAYSSSTPSETIAGLKCSIATKVINYANKGNLTTSPDIILYGCASGTPKLDNTMTSFDAKGMTYIVKVNNPAWVDFANNIKVE